MRQALRLLAVLMRHPILMLRAHLRLIARGLFYLSENPDVVRARDLMNPPESGARLVIEDRGEPIFSLILTSKKTDQAMPAQEIRIDAAVFDQINSRLVAEKDRDAFFIAGREILAALSRRQIIFSPILPEAEMLASLDGEELLAKFGPRYGLSLTNPVKFYDVLSGLGLALISPVTRKRMRNWSIMEEIGRHNKEGGNFT